MSLPEPRPHPAEVRRVALVGAGLIGAGWAAFFCARGFDVAVYDPSPAASAAVPGFVEAAWPAMLAAGTARSSTPRLPTLRASVEETCADAHFVQESGPDRLETKADTIARIDAASPPDVVIASSSSSLLVSDYQRPARHPGRVVAAHPFNPPHLLPLVEVVGGDATTPEAIDWTAAFFEATGKSVVRLRRETPGYVANRMAAALYREAVHLVASGVASVADVDRAVRDGPGLRWALMGPHLIYGLAGGDRGYRGYLEHLGPGQERRWDTLQSAPLSSDLIDLLVEGLHAELAEAGDTGTPAWRDDALVRVLRARSTAAPPWR